MKSVLKSARRGVVLPLVAALGLLAGLPAAAEPSAAKKELIAKVVQLQQPGVESLARSLVDQSALVLLQQAEQLLPRVPADKREATTKAIQADTRKYLDEVGTLARDKAVKLAPGVMSPLLDEKFSEDELKQLVGWLESPVIKRYQQITPELQKGLSEKIVAETRASVEPKLQALERRIGEHLGVAPAASAPATKKK